MNSGFVLAGLIVLGIMAVAIGPLQVAIVIAGAVMIWTGGYHAFTVAIETLRRMRRK